MKRVQEAVLCILGNRLWPHHEVTDIVDSRELTFRLLSQYLETWRKWPTSCRQYFQIQFLEWKLLYFYWNLTKFFSGCFWWSSRQHVMIGSGNDLAPNREQAIIWTNLDQDPRSPNMLIALVLPAWHWSSLDSPHKGPVIWGFDVFFVASLKNSWIAVDSKCNAAHVTSL